MWSKLTWDTKMMILMFLEGFFAGVVVAALIISFTN